MLIELKKDAISKVFYLSFKRLLPVGHIVTVSTKSTFVNIDYDQTLWGIEMLGGLKYVNIAHDNKQIKVIVSNDILSIIFNSSNLKEDPLEYEDMFIKNKIKIYLDNWEIARLDIALDLIGNGDNQYEILFK
jgi:hypothetical protein